MEQEIEHFDDEILSEYCKQKHKHNDICRTRYRN